MFVCKFSDHAHPGVYSCPAVMRIRTKTDLSEALIQMARDHNDHRPVKDKGLNVQMKEQIVKHKDKTAGQIRKEIQKEQAKQGSELRGLKIPTNTQIKKQKQILGEKEGHTAQLSLEDVEALYEDNRTIPEEEDIPYCSGFGKQEVPRKTAKMARWSGNSS
uniref:Uncharacterized protein n=1 Tax=Ditylenchus dipsaci TaxID=166011 RepID=A0A915CMF9_9BILA